MVYWLEQWARRQGRHFPGVKTTWTGIRGGQVPRIRNTLVDMLHRLPGPDLLILHIGSNDILNVTACQLRHDIINLLQMLREMLPGTVIIFSEILPRLWYFGARDQNAVDKARKNIARYIRNHVSSIGIQILSHPAIDRHNFSLFRRDGVHLSDCGQAILWNNYTDAIKNFISAQR